MGNKLLKFLNITLFLLLIVDCQKRILKKDDLVLLNEYYGKKTYFLREDVPINNKEVIKKGTSVKIWIESTSSLLKVKCYPSNTDRESALGKMVSYLINEDIRGKSFTQDNLDNLIGQKLEVYVVKRNKTTPNKKK
jgi:type II secretion system-associated lipoprotein